MTTSTAGRLDTSATPGPIRGATFGRAAATTGVLAAALTMFASLVSLALLVPTLVLGAVSLRRGERAAAAAVGLTAALVSAWLIGLEMFVLGG